MNISVYAIPGVNFKKTDKNYKRYKTELEMYFRKTLERVSNYYGINADEVLVPSKTKGAKNEDLVKIRLISIWLLTNYGRGTKSQISAFFNRNRAVVNYAEKRIPELRQFDRRFREETDVFLN